MNQGSIARDVEHQHAITTQFHSRCVSSIVTAVHYRASLLFAGKFSSGTAGCTEGLAVAALALSTS